MARRQGPVVIGWNEPADLPDWGLQGVKAKIDTGARSSSIHVDDLRELPGGLVSFIVCDGPRSAPVSRQITAAVVRRGRVRSSTGDYAWRIFVRTTLLLAGRRRAVDLNLVDRGVMLFPMLIGRTALRSWYLVDPGRKRLTTPAGREED